MIVDARPSLEHLDARAFTLGHDGILLLEDVVVVEGRLGATRKIIYEVRAFIGSDAADGDFFAH